MPLTAEMAIGRGDHAHEAGAVGFECIRLHVGSQGRVLPADARAVQIEVHAAHAGDELLQPAVGTFLPHVDGGGKHTVGRQLAQGFQTVGTAAGKAEGPSLLKQQEGHFAAQAGGGSHDDGFLCCHGFLRLNCLVCSVAMFPRPFPLSLTGFHASGERRGIHGRRGFASGPERPHFQSERQ